MQNQPPHVTRCLPPHLTSASLDPSHIVEEDDVGGVEGARSQTKLLCRQAGRQASPGSVGGGAGLCGWGYAGELCNARGQDSATCKGVGGHPEEVLSLGAISPL
uniref:Uncharacterized protein n=1 Tax=Sphaerodactylus townsendi TaxID=933632 RepID=A0ACB8EQI6_9SAUR